MTLMRPFLSSFAVVVVLLAYGFLSEEDSGLFPERVVASQVGKNETAQVSQETSTLAPTSTTTKPPSLALSPALKDFNSQENVDAMDDDYEEDQLEALQSDIKEPVAASADKKANGSKKGQPNPQVAAEDEGVWLPVNRTKPGWPSDIVCKQGSHQCKRECAGGRPNEILYIYRNHGGLKDRFEHFDWVSELAAYLCATVYVHSPHEILYTKLNHGKEISPDLKWTDFIDVTLPDGTTVLKALGEETFKEKDAHEWQVFETWSAKNKLDRKNPSKLDLWPSLQIAVELSMKPNTKFAWKLGRNAYFSKNMAKDLKHQGPMEEYGVPSTLLHGPYLNYERNVKYTQTVRSHVVDLIADDIWQKMQEEHPGAMLGTWHIRRGDAKGECNTEIPRMTKYVQCTFSQVDEKILLMIQTEETNAKYKGALENIFKQHANNVELVWMDPVVLKHQKELPAKLRNNYHTFEIGNALAEMASEFILEHRRQRDCRDCYNLREYLDSQK